MRVTLRTGRSRCEGPPDTPFFLFDSLLFLGPTLLSGALDPVLLHGPPFFLSLTFHVVPSEEKRLRSSVMARATRCTSPASRVGACSGSCECASTAAPDQPLQPTSGAGSKRPRMRTPQPDATSLPREALQSKDRESEAMSRARIRAVMESVADREDWVD